MLPSVRIVAFVTQASVIDQILPHLGTREARRQYDCRDHEERRRNARATTHHVPNALSASCGPLPRLPRGALRAR